MNYQSYYRTPGVRNICHAVKHNSPAAIKTIAEYLTEQADIKSHDIIVPVPQHTGRATYNRSIADIISTRTGAKTADILRCKPRETLYKQKLRQSEQLHTDFYLADEIPTGKIYIIDNVIATGQTIFDISELLKTSFIPLVFAVDETRFNLWDDLRNI
jgi:predicted amidophosphoribosyltransferase